MAGDEVPREPRDDESRDDVSRRDALKKIGIGAGIAWSAPVVLSFYNAAGAATGTPESPTTPSTGTVPSHPECIGATCATFSPCSSSNPDCICASTPDPSVAFCVPGSTLCATLTACAADFTCPPGSFCAVDSCCTVPVCVPLSLAAACPPDDLPPGGAGAAQKPTRVKTGAGTLGG